MAETSLPLLNVFEVQVDGATRHLLCFLDTVLAGVKGIDPRWTIGELTPGPDGTFDASSLTLNPEFIASVTAYMNDQAARAPEIVAEATDRASEWLYILDPRYHGPPDEAPPSEVLGCYAIDNAGQIAPGSFQYNQHHVWFEPTFGVSGVLEDRQFYDWLHPVPSP